MYIISEGVLKQLLIMYTFLNQMRIGKNIQHKDDKMNSLYYIFNLFLNRRSAEPSKRNKICFLRSIFYHKNHLNLSEKVIHIKNQFMSILFATYSVLANLHFQNWCPILYPSLGNLKVNYQEFRFIEWLQNTAN